MKIILIKIIVDNDLRKEITTCFKDASRFIGNYLDVSHRTTNVIQLSIHVRPKKIESFIKQEENNIDPLKNPALYEAGFQLIFFND